MKWNGESVAVEQRSPTRWRVGQIVYWRRPPSLPAGWGYLNALMPDVDIGTVVYLHNPRQIAGVEWQEAGLLELPQSMLADPHEALAQALERDLLCGVAS